MICIFGIDIFSLILQMYVWEKKLEETYKNGWILIVPHDITGHAPVTPAVDIYSFGMAALEMAALEIPGNGDSGNIVTQEQVREKITAQTEDDIVIMKWIVKF